MKIKSIILVAVAMFAFTTTVLAKPVKPGQWKVITLADGTEVRVEAKGDEYVQFFQSEDGRVFEMTQQGQFNEISREVVSQRAKAARLAEKERIAELTGNEVQKNLSLGGNHDPFIGTKRCLCILMEFKDLKFHDENNIDAYNSLINQIGYSNPDLGHDGSVRDYFLAQSNGQFDMQFDVVGPYTTQNNHAYYVNSVYKMVEEAVTKANPDVNFQDYDWDGDGKAEPIFIVYAGPARSDHPDDPEYADYIWPHASSIWKFLDGVTISNYACGAELDYSGTIDGIGTMCHEYSHCLGLPDIYDVDYECDVHGLPGDWDVMHGGCYNGGGNIPASYNAYERMYCGWITPQELPTDGHVENFSPIAESGQAYIYRNDKNSNEYYLFEVHGKDGFDAALPGSGMLVYHVDFDKNVWEMNGVNCLSRQSSNKHEHFTILPANNSLDKNSSGQAFPNASNNRITFYTAPTLEWFKNDSQNHKYAELCIYNIERDADGNISFDVAKDLPKTPAPEGAVFYESFNRNNLPGSKGGRDGKYSAYGSFDSCNDNLGWDASNLLSGSECALVGSGSTQSNGEYALSPMITLEDGVDYTLSFSAAPFSIKTAAITVSVASGNAEVQNNSCPMVRSNWTDFTTTLRGSGNIRLKFERSNGFYLDDVLVIPTADGIVNTTVDNATDGRVFNVLGQQVNPSAKGLLIRNGKKYVNK